MSYTDDVLAAGGFDADTLIGGNGDDTLSGGLDANQLEGGEGNDVLNGFGWARPAGQRRRQ